MKTYVTQEIAKVNIRIDDMDRRLPSEISTVEKRLDDMNKRFEDVNARLDNHFLLLLAWVGFIGVVIGTRRYSLPYSVKTNARWTRKLKHNSKLKRCSKK